MNFTRLTGDKAHTKDMENDFSPALSNSAVRRLRDWARNEYPADWEDRSAVLVEYLSQLDGDACDRLVKQGWPVVLEKAREEWPESFEGWEAVTEQEASS